MSVHSHEDDPHTPTYLAGSHSTLEGVCAHLVFPDTTPEVFVAFLVANDWDLSHIEDSFISSAFHKTEREKERVRGGKGHITIWK